jgi:hypothetical protein
MTNAIDDWQNEEIGSTLLQEAIDAYRSGDVVT